MYEYQATTSCQETVDVVRQRIDEVRALFLQRPSWIIGVDDYEVGFLPLLLRRPDVRGFDGEAFSLSKQLRPAVPPKRLVVQSRFRVILVLR